MPDPEFMRHPDAYAMIDPSKSKQIKISDDLITKPEDMPPGLIRHEQDTMQMRKRILVEFQIMLI